MKDNTFDVPGYRFAIIYRDDFTYNSLVNMYVEENNDDAIMEAHKVRGIDSHTSLIDFGQIDGLTLDELDLFKYVNLDAIFFAMYDKISGQTANYTPFDYNNFYNTFLFKLSKYDRGMTVDKALELELKERYQNADSSIKRRIKCFLQRYRYNTMEEVLDALGEENRDSLPKQPLK